MDTEAIDRYGPDALITVTAGLRKLDGNERPYFSVTGAVRSDSEMGGCIHREILRRWPELAPVVALHSEANGWYWLAGYYDGAGERYHGGNGQRQHWRDGARMKATIVVNMDGAAFEEGRSGAELCEVLRRALDKIEWEPEPGTVKLLDSTGNTCGRLTISGGRA